MHVCILTVRVVVVMLYCCVSIFLSLSVVSLLCDEYTDKLSLYLAAISRKTKYMHYS